MKLDRRALRRLIKEEMSRAVEAHMNEEEVEEGVGGHGSPSGREASDTAYEDALEYLQQLMARGSDAVVDAVQQLRGGETEPSTWHDSMNKGAPESIHAEGEEDAVEEADEAEETEETNVDEEEEVNEITSNEGEEVHREGEEPTLTGAMQGHIDNAEDDIGPSHVQESFNSRRLGHLAGILEG